MLTPATSAMRLIVTAPKPSRFCYPHDGVEWGLNGARTLLGLGASRLFVLLASSHGAYVIREQLIYILSSCLKHTEIVEGDASRQNRQCM